MSIEFKLPESVEEDFSYRGKFLDRPFLIPNLGSGPYVHLRHMEHGKTTLSGSGATIASVTLHVATDNDQPRKDFPYVVFRLSNCHYREFWVPVRVLSPTELLTKEL